MNANFITGLPDNGPDSIIFDAAGHMLISNTDAGTISIADPSTGHVLTPQINKTSIRMVTDLALNPLKNEVWAVEWDGPHLTRVSLADGTTTSYVDAAHWHHLGGIVFLPDGRLFIASHSGFIDQIDPTTGTFMKQLVANGRPDGMTYDPTRQTIFVSGCDGLCEITPDLAHVSVHTAAGLRNADSVDGIAADGLGHVFLIHYGPPGQTGDLSRLDLAGNGQPDKVSVVQDGIPSSDDVAPLVGPGAPPTPSPTPSVTPTPSSTPTPTPTPSSTPTPAPTPTPTPSPTPPPTLAQTGGGPPISLLFGLTLVVLALIVAFSRRVRKPGG